ncbi:CV039 protein, partial [Penelope pileata]|nr:CV039 protein [Penelope pileata]
QPPRPCEDYWWEWKHCRGLRHAFHHYYAHGELPACGRWREDYDACRAWESSRSAAAQVRPARPRGGSWVQRHAPVWALRSSPPPDWHRPLQPG